MAAGQTMIGRDREVAELEGALTRTALGAAPGAGRSAEVARPSWRESPLAPFVEALATPLTELAGDERFGRYLWGAKTRFQPEAHFG
jgi:hypothetical protein